MAWRLRTNEIEYEGLFWVDWDGYSLTASQDGEVVVRLHLLGRKDPFGLMEFVEEVTQSEFRLGPGVQNGQIAYWTIFDHV
jgi:hypothetical protein